MTESLEVGREVPARRDGRPRLVVLAVVGAFVLPIALAWAAAFGFIPGWAPGRLHHGLLLTGEQARALDLEGATNTALEHDFGQWSVVVLAAPDCAPPCVFNDGLLSRFAQAIATDGERVFIYRAGTAPLVPPGIRALPLTDGERAALEALGGDAPAEALIVDYRRRPVLAYPTPSVPADILKDLRRLLRASRAP